MSKHDPERVELFALELEREWPEVSAMLSAYAGELRKPMQAIYEGAWCDLFWKVARELNCLPSTFVDGNDHVLRAARSLSRQAASEWQPIESAPKNELILVAPTRRMDVCVAMNHSRDGWVTETPGEWVSIYTPAKWMPLPSPSGGDEA